AVDGHRDAAVLGGGVGAHAASQDRGITVAINGKGSVRGGGGLWMDNGAVWMTDDSQFLNNRVINPNNGGGPEFAGVGGAMYVHPCDCESGVRMSGNAKCSLNRAGVGAGIVIPDGPFLGYAGLWLEDDASITRNRADSYAAGFFLNGVPLWMENDAAITENTSMGAVGGGMITGFMFNGDSYDYALDMLDNARISGNTSVNAVGGVNLQAAYGRLQGSATISGNRAEFDGGGVYLSWVEFGPDTNSWFSGIDLYDSSTITGNIAANSDTGSGGGVYSDLPANEVIGGERITGNTPDDCVGSASPTCNT
ncbi:MAG: hypothetical protein ACKOWF_17270, partial [Chloroflexota bacterium]